MLEADKEKKATGGAETFVVLTGAEGVSRRPLETMTLNKGIGRTFQAGGITGAKPHIEACSGCCRNREEACVAGAVSEGEHAGGEGRDGTGTDCAEPCGLQEDFGFYK